MSWDERLGRWIQARRTPGLQAIMRLVSWPGWPPRNWILTTLTAGLIYRRGFRLAAFLVMAALPVEIAVALVKRRVNRARPMQPEDNTAPWPADPSFPSGHTVQYTLVFGLLAYLARLHLDSGPAKLLSIILLGIPIVIVGPSRIYLGHHWPTDVMAGYSLGLGLLISFVQVYERLRPRSRDV